MKLPYFSFLEHQASKDFPFEAFHKTYFLQIQYSAKKSYRNASEWECTCSVLTGVGS